MIYEESVALLEAWQRVTDEERMYQVTFNAGNWFVYLSIDLVHDMPKASAQTMGQTLAEALRKAAELVVATPGLEPLVGGSDV